jgi:hypothetical protein
MYPTAVEKEELNGPQRGARNSDRERFEPLLGSVEAAKLLQIYPKTLQKLARTGGVPAHLICGL